MKRFLLAAIFLIPVPLLASVVEVASTTFNKVVSIAVLHEDGVVGGGSGVFISSRGHVLTCAHLFRREGVKLPANVTTKQGVTYAADLMRLSMNYDLALLKINETTPYVALSTSPYVVGEKVIVMGHSLGFRYTVTTGIISGFNRSVAHFSKLLQISAPINPGNSGGPVLNTTGRLIGLAQLVVPSTRFSGYTGLSFAASIETIKLFFEPYVGLEEILK